MTLAKNLCRSHYYEEYRKTRKDKAAENSARWRKNNPDKIKASNAIRRKRYKKYSSKLNRNIVIALLKTQSHCQACLLKFSNETIATLDHKIPLSRGGEHEIDNLHLLCFSCNASKGSKTWEEFQDAIKSSKLSSNSPTEGEGNVVELPVRRGEGGA